MSRPPGFHIPGAQLCQPHRGTPGMSDFGSHRGISVTKACLPFPEGLGQRRRGGAAVGGTWTGVQETQALVQPVSVTSSWSSDHVLLGWIRKWDGRIKCLSEVRILHLLTRKTEPPFAMGRVQVPNPEDQFHQDRAGLQCQRPVPRQWMG